MSTALIGVLINLLIMLTLVIRVMTRPHRDPTSRIAWVAVISALPVVGVIAYLLLGETNIGRRRTERMKEVIAGMPTIMVANKSLAETALNRTPKHLRHLFRIGKSINGFDPACGNSALLMKDSNSTIDAMVADIDAAIAHVHLMFYIWSPDNNGIKMIEALKRAAARGVECRALADDIGSRRLIHSPHWEDMESAGVKVARALPVRNPFLRALLGRIDLRNHRKILVIDGKVTYCGSQNCADPDFISKAKYAPWVDSMMRFEGPVAAQNQYLFASDWMSYTEEDINPLLELPLKPPASGFPAQVIGTGPTVRHSSMPELFESLLHAARDELVISTPYYVPDESMQNALCAAAWRGVKTSIIFPANNDSWMVAAASRSYYMELLDAGVQIYEFHGGLLHAKTLTLDAEITLIGSANMDRRSFELNYENNILLYDPNLTNDVRARQQEYIAQSNPVALKDVESWSLTTRLWNNTLALLGPVL